MMYPDPLRIVIILGKLSGKDRLVTHQDYLTAEVLLDGLHGTFDFRMRRSIAAKGIQGYAHITP
jgi:hypothetical protein